MKLLNTHSRASALLISFFLMSVLVLVGMAVSVLVIHDLRASHTMVSGAQALYAAEGMTELGLELQKENLPGYEPVLTDYVFLNNALASLTVHARENDVPCTDQGNEWRALGQNESIQIPLFAQATAEGAMEKVNLFYVDFYVADANGEVFAPPTDDVLRWKILGLKTETTDTQAVSEYIPLNGTHITAVDPSVFGTTVDSSVPDGYTWGKFYDASGYRSILNPIYPITSFLETHDYNYLVLTNVVRSETEDTIYFKFHGQDHPGVCEYAKLATVGTGASGDTKQELTTLVKEGENLPVYDFVLYHTGQDSGPSSALSPSIPFPSSSFPWSH